MEKRLRLDSVLLVLAFQILPFVFEFSSRAQSADRDRDWNIVRGLIGKIHGISTAPPSDLINPKYTSGAIMGNGDIGVVAGDTSVTKQSFYFAKSDFWGSGARYEGLPAVGTIPHNLPDCNWSCRVSILSLGKLTVSSPTKSDDAGRTYRVDQDILNARVDTTLGLGRSTVHLGSWTADGVNTFVTELTSEGASGSDLPIRVGLAMPNPGSAAPPGFPIAAGSRDGVLWATRENGATGPLDYKARAAIAVRIVGANVNHVDTAPGEATASFILKSGTPVWIVTVFESDGRMGLNGPTAMALAQAAMIRASNTSEFRIARMEKEHLEWWKKFWLQSFVQFHDKILEEYYYGALYAVACANRPGKLAPSLFGNFITTNDVAWGGLYFMNYNEEAPYYGVFSSNHPELAEPYIRMVPLCANMSETSRPSTITVGRGKKSHFDEHKQDKYFFRCVGSFGA